MPIQGGANALGPNSLGRDGQAHRRACRGFAYSDALEGRSGHLDLGCDERLARQSRRNIAPGTKMTFAGLGNPEDRANVMAFLNSRSASPLPLPAAPAASPDKAAAEAEDAGAEKAENEPVLTEQQAGTQSQECRRRRRGQADRPRGRRSKDGFQFDATKRRRAPLFLIMARDAVPRLPRRFRTS